MLTIYRCLLILRPPFTATDPMKVYTIILRGFDQLEFPRHISRWDLFIYPQIRFNLYLYTQSLETHWTSWRDFVRIILQRGWDIKRVESWISKSTSGSRLNYLMIDRTISTKCSFAGFWLEWPDGQGPPAPNPSSHSQPDRCLKLW